MMRRVGLAFALVSAMSAGAFAQMDGANSATQSGTPSVASEQVRERIDRLAGHLDLIGGSDRLGFEEPQGGTERRPLTRGWFPRLGGIRVGSGIGGGIGYRLPVFDHRAVLTASAAISVRGYWDEDAGLQWPSLLAGRLTLGTTVRYAHFAREHFFGIGPDVSTRTEGEYGQRQIDWHATATWRLASTIAVGARFGVADVSIRPGSPDQTESLAAQFPSAVLPGLLHQSPFVHAHAFVERSTEDVPEDPHHGGHYRAIIARYQDTDTGRYSFDRLDVEGWRMFRLDRAARNRLALRGTLTLTHTAPGHEMPFYLMPVLGGSQLLRGFSDFRFRDRNRIVFTAQYERELASFIDGLLFVDRGTVASRVVNLDRDFRTSGGGGVHFHYQRRSLLNVEVAASQEGVRLALLFTPTF